MKSQSMNSKILGLVLALLSVMPIWPQAEAQEDRNVSTYNLDESGVGLKGYDPVAPFPEGSGAPTPGHPEIQVNYAGVTYFFVSEAHRNLFLSSPERYEPTYGGWCAYAMASGSQVDINPLLVTINGNRAHYFVSSRAKRNFDSNISDYEARADVNWKKISGEEPRL